MFAALLVKKKALRDERLENDRGFTLIELLVVVVIIGILIAIAIPLYSNYKKGAENKSAKSDLRNAIPVVEQCYTDNANAYPTAGTQASAGAPMTFTGCSGSVNSSSQNTLTYAISGSTWTMTAKNSDGGTTYTYTSSSATITP